MIRTLRSADGALAQISAQGAQLLSWIPAGQTEQLFLSKTASFEAGQAIRGGVPIIFPQFAGLGPLPKHGFLRNRLWQSEQSDRPDFAVFTLSDDAATRALWPHAFLVELSVAVAGNALDMTLAVHNTGSAPFDFTVALHSYFRVADINDVRILGLQNCRYQDGVESAAHLAINGPIDRIYQNTPQQIELRSHQQRIVLQREGFPDAVVWNPWIELGAALADLEPGGYRRMLCVESAAIVEPIQLVSGAVWRGVQKLISYPA